MNKCLITFRISSKILHFRFVSALAVGLAGCFFITGCGTTSPRAASRSLPAYEPPIAKADSQIVRTTAYTHSEDDHLEYGAHNALGGILQSATTPGRSSEPVVRRAVRITDIRESDDLTFATLTREERVKELKKAKAKAHKKEAKAKGKKGKPANLAHARKPEPPRIGSAAADWSRWPVGTTFRIISTGQIYRVDDTGWALAGRNTIDLYMSSRGDMNSWGVRTEPIKVLACGDPQQSLALLQARQHYKHCRRMALEMQGLEEQAAALH